MAEGGNEKQNDDNPFSFKQFVKQSDKKDGDLSDDFSDEDETDEFDLLKSTSQSKQRPQLIVEDDVPAKDNNPFSFKKFLQTGPPNSGVIYDLPDLLDTVDSTECASPPNGLSEDLDVRRMRELTEENGNLRRALRESQLRVGQVELQMKQQAVKEAEETQALEQMVQQVEGNLKTANSRALKAEQTIVQLRQEISILKANSADPQSIMKDKTKYAAEQLAATATTAEANLKQMMEGVKKLRLMSEILASVDSVTEES